jgi:hypothetical protein
MQKGSYVNTGAFLIDTNERWTSVIIYFDLQ